MGEESQQIRTIPAFIDYLRSAEPKTAADDRRAADELERLRADLEQSQEIRADMADLLAMIGERLGVSDEPHQTWQERLLEALPTGGR